MIKKHIVLIGVIIAISFILVATSLYPGGSMFDKNSVGFAWSENFISNLFAAKAMNGADNPARICADIGMIFLAISFAIFFARFSARIPNRSAANVIKYFGIASMVFEFLIVTPLHDIMVTISGTLYLVSVFYITVFVFKSRLHLMKVLCVVCLLLFYFTMFIYGAGSFALLAIMQKATFLSSALLVLCLEYFTSKEDFQHISSVKTVNNR